MGAWGTGIFDSDGALDFVLALTGTLDLVLVQQALDDVDDLDVDVCERGLVAGEVVAALRGSPGDLPSDLADWLVGKPAASTAMQSQAYQAVLAIRDNSELRELWQETDDFSEWQRGIDDLLERLIA